MAISKAVDGWLVDIQPGGRSGKRFRKTLPTKAEAIAWETWVKAQVQQSPEWQPTRRDSRRLSDLVDLWHKYHGISLRAGNDTVARLRALSSALGNPFADQLKPEDFAAYRAKRLADGISANNLNREHAYLRAVFNELERLGQWKGTNPLAKVRQIKIVERELSFLNLKQIEKLLSELSGDELLIAKICLMTGARWSEGEELRPSQVRHGLIHFTGTKSGKNRSVPVDESLIKELEAHLEARYKDGKELAQRYFVKSYFAFSRAIDRCKIALPKGQLTHVLRHTFASHFIMNGGNILTLQKILGHSSLTMTMRYAHLAPDHLQEAKAFNPLRTINQQTTN